MGTLGELIAASAVRPVPERVRMPVARAAATGRFESALRRDDVAVIAEIKRRSPSRGVINARIEPALQARSYAAGGAAAISVLTEPIRFGGTLEDLAAVANAVSMPVLRKDFLISEAQLLESSANGASAALLIVRAIPPAQLAALANVAREIGLEILFEVRTESEMEAALEAGARIIGVNNRDLETLEVDSGTVARLLPLVPSEVVAVAESGYSTRAGIEAAARAGADAVLVGSALSGTAEPQAAVAALTGVPRRGR